MLISRSPVFCAMFTGPAKDANENVKIEDVDKETFMQMLRYRILASKQIQPSHPHPHHRLSKVYFLSLLDFLQIL